MPNVCDSYYDPNTILIYLIDDLSPLLIVEKKVKKVDKLISL